MMEDSFNLGPAFWRQHRLPVKASASHMASAARGVEGHIIVSAGGNMINIRLTSMNGRIRPGGDMPCTPCLRASNKIDAGASAVTLLDIGARWATVACRKGAWQPHLVRLQQLRKEVPENILQIGVLTSNLLSRGGPNCRIHVTPE